MPVQAGNTTLQVLAPAVEGRGETGQVTSTPPLLRPAESAPSTVATAPRAPLHRLHHAPAQPQLRLAIRSCGHSRTAGGEDSGYANGNGSNAFTGDGTQCQQQLRKEKLLYETARILP